jgi:hypothetical protein
MPERPTGISVLAILAGIFGVILIIGGLFVGVSASAVSVSDLAKEYIETYAATLGVSVTALTAIIEAVLVAIAVIAFVFGILYIVVAYGFWIGAGWSRLLAIILSILGIILGLITATGGIGIVLIIIYAVILWYLMQRHVKAFFGAAPQPTPPPAPPP